MKKIAFVLLTLAMSVLGTGVNAQGTKGKYGSNPEDSVKCVRYLDFYQQHYKSKSFDEALPNWREAYRICPHSANQNMLLNGTELLKRQVSKTRDKAAREAIIDSIMTLQDERAANFPKYSSQALNNKAKYAVIYRADDYEFLYKTIGDVVEQNKEYTNFGSYVPYYQSAFNLFKDGKLTEDDMINIYFNASDNLEKAETIDSVELVKLNLSKADIKKFSAALDNAFSDSQVADCETLLPLQQSRLDADPDNVDVARKVVRALNSAEGCVNNDTYVKAATMLYNNEPSASTAYSLYILNKVRGDKDAALGYIEEAVGFDDVDNETKAKYLNEAAGYVQGTSTSKALDYAKRAAALDDKYQGTFYYMTANAWMSASGVTINGKSNEMSARAKYWVAIDYYQKAKSADPSLSEACNAAIGRASSGFPAKADAFMYDLTNGQTVSVSSSAGSASTTVRTR